MASATPSNDIDPASNLEQDPEDPDELEMENRTSQIAALVQTRNTCPKFVRCNQTCGEEHPTFCPILTGKALSFLTMDPGPEFPEHGVPLSALIPSYSDEPYIYEPIDSEAKQFRLLKVRSAVYLDQPLDCELLVVSLNDPPPYSTLSYTWGPPVFDHEIFCDGKVMKVTSSLFNGLKRFRHDWERHEEVDGLIWADAICIDQTNVQGELSPQLGLMRRIYQQGERCNIDLGEVHNDWFCGYDMIRKLSHAWGSEPKRKLTSPEQIPDLPDPKHMAWRLFMHMFGRTQWLQRTWIIQEVALSKSAVVMFGRFVFKWEDLVNSWKMFMQLGVWADLSSDSQNGIVNMARIVNICEGWREESLNVVQLMRWTRDFKVTNWKDKIWAVYALIGHMEQGMKPDYALPMHVLYRTFAAGLLEQTGSAADQSGIDLFPLAGLHKRRLVSGLPSWAPDWSAQSLDEFSKPLDTIRWVRYKAAGASKPNIKMIGPSEQTARMLIEGAIIDTVTLLASPAIWHSADERRLARGKWYKSTEALFEEAVNTGQVIYDNHKDVFSRTLIVNDLYTGGNATLRSTSIENPVSTLEEVVSNLDREEGRKEGGEVGEVGTYAMQMYAASRFRRFVVTENGFMGLVPFCAEAGDRVCIFLGSSTPFLIREKESSSFELVGDAYIHGVMDGEALESKNWQPEMLELC